MTTHPTPSERARQLVRGGYDMHVHIDPDFVTRIIDDVSLARRCLELGLAGFQMKSHYTSTAERARTVNAAVPGVARDRRDRAQPGGRRHEPAGGRDRRSRGRAHGLDADRQLDQRDGGGPQLRPRRADAGVDEVRGLAARGGSSSRSRWRCSTATVRCSRRCTRSWRSPRAISWCWRRATWLATRSSPSSTGRWRLAFATSWSPTPSSRLRT